MGQKVNPISFRLGISADWRSRWYARKREFGALVVQDSNIRRHVKAKYAFAGVSRIDIERTREEVRVILHCARPGVIIGRKGVEVDRLRGQLQDMLDVKVDLRIEEVHHPELSAQLVAEALAEQLSRRASFRRAIRKVAETTMGAGARGVRIRLAGRLGGSEMSRKELLRVGSVPLHTLRAKIDYGFAESKTTYGHIGIKVWINLGMMDETEEPSKRLR